MKTFVDLDGVLADFFSTAVRMSEGEVKPWRDMEHRDIKKVLEKITKTPRFFANLKPFSMANTLTYAVHNIAGGYSILSSPLSGYDGCAEEKIEWVKTHLHIEPEEIIITDDKPQYARGNILIDDYGNNIAAWEKHGGFGIKYQADEDRLAEVLIPLTALYKGKL